MQAFLILGGHYRDPRTSCPSNSPAGEYGPEQSIFSRMTTMICIAQPASSLSGPATPTGSQSYRASLAHLPHQASSTRGWATPFLPVFGWALGHFPESLLTARPGCPSLAPPAPGASKRPSKRSGSYQFRVQGPVRSSVHSLAVKAVSQDHHHCKDLRHGAAPQDGHKPSSVEHTGSNEAGAPTRASSLATHPQQGGHTWSLPWKDKSTEIQG